MDQFIHVRKEGEVEIRKKSEWKKRRDLFTLQVDSIANFSWTARLFFQVLGTEYEKVKEIMVIKS